MGRLPAQSPRVRGLRRQTLAGVPGPNAIDNHSGRKRIFGAYQVICQGGSPPGGMGCWNHQGIRRIKQGDKTGCDGTPLFLGMGGIGGNSACLHNRLGLGERRGFKGFVFGQLAAQ